jgi:hypothetical protein
VGPREVYGLTAQVAPLSGRPPDRCPDDVEVALAGRRALWVVADLIKTFVIKPHQDLGRAGPVCPFVPGSLERETLWLAPEKIADRGMPEVVELISGYQRLFLDAQPTDGDEATYKSIVVLFTDLPAVASASRSPSSRWRGLRSAACFSSARLGRARGLRS